MSGRSRLLRWSSALGAFALAVMGSLVFSASPASAHGEASQDPFLKTQTIAWFDVAFSKDRVKQGEELQITGKFRVLTEWPENTLPPPDTAFLQVGMPGPVLTVRDRRINGEFAPQTIRLEIGKTYDFSYVLAGRREGRWHVHPGVSVRSAGIILGPGQWINVDHAPGYKNEVELLNGDKINLENFGVGSALGWHLLLALPGVLLLVYWLAPKPILWRATWVAAGDEAALMTPTDRKFTYGMGGLAVLITVVGALYAGAKWDVIPIQFRAQDAVALDEPARFVEAKTTTASWDEPTGTLTMDVKVTNTGTSPITLQSMHSSTEVFRNKELFGPASPGFDPAHEGRYLVAEPAVVAPGQTATIKITIVDKVLAERRLVPEAEAQARLGGALVFTDAAGTRNIVDIAPEVISTHFTAGH